jgi:short-subunit dehydrogenase
MKGIYIGSLASAVMPPAAVVYHGTKGPVDVTSCTLAKELETKISVSGLIRQINPEELEK